MRTDRHTQTSERSCGEWFDGAQISLLCWSSRLNHHQTRPHHACTAADRSSVELRWMCVLVACLRYSSSRLHVQLTAQTSDVSWCVSVPWYVNDASKHRTSRTSFLVCQCVGKTSSSRSDTAVTASSISVLLTSLCHYSVRVCFESVNITSCYNHADISVHYYYYYYYYYY